MTHILTPEQMREVERAAINSGALTGLKLMENAGRAVVDAMVAKWPQYEDDMDKRRPSAVVLCGPGNNGGDGFVIARLLAERGWRVEVYLWGDADKLPPDARHNHDLWAAMGAVGRLDPKAGAPFVADVLVDALFGTGLDRPVDVLEPLFDDLHDSLMGVHSPNYEVNQIVAVDIPSWLSAATGRMMLTNEDATVPGADLTVTFHAAKPGHFLEDGPWSCGDLVVAPIGIPNSVHASPAHLRGGEFRPKRGARSDVHKYQRGHALILTGPAGQTGAGRLAARAALRGGAGVVTMGCPADAMAELALPPDALMRRVVENADDLHDMLDDPRITALCLGPGMGVERAAALLPVALQSGRAIVIDADGLTALARAPDLFAMLHERCILTPHEGEFARLFPDLAARMKAPVSEENISRIEATRRAAEHSGAVVLLKGPATVVASPSRRVEINLALDVPWLATAGAGDVLAGMLAGALASADSGPYRVGAPRLCDMAVRTAALHAACARAFGPGLIADDLPELIPAMLREIGG